MSIPPELAGAIPLIDRFQVCDYFIPTSSATCATFVKTEYPSCQFGNRSEIWQTTHNYVTIDIE